MKIKHIYILLTIILSVGAFLFWWYQVRPAEIRKICFQKAGQGLELAMQNFSKQEIAASNVSENLDWAYKKCCQSKGLKE